MFLIFEFQVFSKFNLSNLKNMNKDSRSLLLIVSISLFLVSCFLIQISFLRDYMEDILYHPTKNFIGFLFSGLFHGSWGHLINNLYVFILFGVVLQLFYFTKDNFKIIIWLYLVTALVHVLIHQFNDYYIGASGWVFAVCWYVIVRGFISKDHLKILISIALLLFNSYLIIGATPAVGARVAWDAHFAGMVVGVFTCFIRLPFVRTS